MTRVARYLISILAVAGILVYCQKHYWPPLRCSYLPNFRLSERLIRLVIRVRLELSLSSAFCSPSRLRIKLLSQSSTIDCSYFRAISGLCGSKQKRDCSYIQIITKQCGTGSFHLDKQSSHCRFPQTQQLWNKDSRQESYSFF